MPVEVEYTSGPGNEYNQKEYPTPGHREVHNKTPTIFLAAEALILLYT